MSTRVKLDTSFGDVVLEMHEEKAPLTAANFLEYVDSGHYAGTVLHRVIDGFMIQGGDPTGTGTGGPGFSEFQGGNATGIWLLRICKRCRRSRGGGQNQESRNREKRLSRRRPA